MSIKELSMLSTEEDVFDTILAWIHHAKRKRQNYFAELFRHVRLLHISRDFLCNDVVTNELVKGYESGSISIFDSKNFENLTDNLHYTPRKVFETPVLITNSQKYFFLYTLGDKRTSELRASRTFSCNGKLYSTRIGSVEYPQDICRLPMSCYDPYSNAWTLLPVSEGNTCLWRIFVNNKDEMFALFLERCGTGEKHVSFIMRYKSELHKWKEIASFNHLDVRQHFTIFLNDVDRYDLNTDQWEKLTGLQISRKRLMVLQETGKLSSLAVLRGVHK
ncbi:unnamed protein product [Pocillopora meandrina]|uniref:BACK domain-containing protein n=1 Tax=Pocillopora meandrina TaxID=46732 RepID=A0AAU9VY02_9CNID|nr:unnamed protein product [Pocillopora meandrina]